MARKLRVLLEGAYYHVYSRGVEKRIIFCDDFDRKVFMTYLKEYSVKYKVDIICYCLMGNHYHLLIRTPFGNLNKMMQCVHGMYVRFFNAKNNRVGSLFQGRYSSRLIDSDEYLQMAARYIHLNPLEVLSTGDYRPYPWSSYKQYFKEPNSHGWLQKQCMLELFDKDSIKAVELFEKFHTMGSESTLTPI